MDDAPDKQTTLCSTVALKMPSNTDWWKSPIFVSWKQLLQAEECQLVPQVPITASYKASEP